MAMGRCDVCGTLIDIDENPEAYRSDLPGTPLLCDNCWEAGEDEEEEDKEE